MNCEQVTRMLSLLVYGELSFDQEEAIHRHLDECAGCRAALERTRVLHAALDGALAEPPPALLAQCRLELDRELAKAAAENSLWRNICKWAKLPPANAWLRPAAALALVIAGFLAGRLIQTAPQPVATPAVVSGAPSSEIVSPPPELNAAPAAAAPGLRDDPGIAAMRRILLRTAEEAYDPGLRLDSLETLRRYTEAPPVRKTFLQVLRNDPNAGVRLKAIEGLQSFTADNEVRSALAQAAQSDSDPAVRIQALDALIKQRDRSLVGLLQRIMDTTSDEDIREICSEALVQMGASAGSF